MDTYLVYRIRHRQATTKNRRPCGKKSDGLYPSSHETRDQSTTFATPIHDKTLPRRCLSRIVSLLVLLTSTRQTSTNGNHVYQASGVPGIYDAARPRLVKKKKNAAARTVKRLKKTDRKKSMPPITTDVWRIRASCRQRRAPRERSVLRERASA